MWSIEAMQMYLIALCLFQLSLLVRAVPQAELLARQHASQTTSRQIRQSNPGSVLSIQAKFEKYALPHINSQKLRPFCNLNLDDAQVCPADQACVEDPWQPEAGSNDYMNQRRTKIGICTSQSSENICSGFAGQARRCKNFENGWQCAKPSRCEREYIPECDWLCVQPPPATLVGIKGFQGI
jgi:hypothetical protein